MVRLCICVGKASPTLTEGQAQGSSRFQKWTYFVLTIATSEQPEVKRTWLRSEGAAVEDHCSKLQECANLNIQLPPSQKLI